MRTLQYRIENRLKLIRWWLATHHRAWRLSVALLAAFAVVAGLWRWWDWVSINSSALAFIAASVTGVALALFAWRTYSLSNEMVEYQHAPAVQLYSISEPEAGEVVVGARQYEGLTWRICLVNIGAGPAWVDSIGIEISPALGRPNWTSLGRLCVFLDKNYDEVNPKKPIIINGHGDISIVIVLYDEKTREHLQRVFGIQEKFVMKVLVYQRRQLGRHDKSVWLQVASQKFELPQKFGQSPRGTIQVSLPEEPPRFHQP